MGGLGNRQRLVQAGMRQNEVVVDVEQRQLMLQPILTLAQRVDTASDRRHALADIQVEPFHKRGVDLPATGSQDLFDRIQRAEYHPVRDPHHALTSVLLDALRIK